MSQSRKKKSWPTAVSVILGQLQLPPEFRHKVSEESLRKNWLAVMGNFLGKKTRVQSIKGRTLFLEVESSALASQLSFMQSEMIQKIEDHIPGTGLKTIRCRVVTDLEHKQAVESERKQESRKKRQPVSVRLSVKERETLEAIADPDMREQFRRLMLYNRAAKPRR